MQALMTQTDSMISLGSNEKAIPKDEFSKEENSSLEHTMQL